MTQKTQSPEFSNSIFIKSLGDSFFYFKLLIYLQEVKRPKCFRGFTPFLEYLLTGLLHEPITEHLHTPTFILLNLCSKIDIRVSHVQDYTVKKMTMMNLIIAKNEFDPYDAMVGQLAIDSPKIS